MIDPTDITDFNRNDAQLEELLLNAISFAGKNARQQATKMDALLQQGKRSPFALIRTWKADGSLMQRLIDSRIGKYRLLHESFDALAHAGIDLRACGVDELVVFPGIGQKTARLFLLHTRPAQEFVVIDTHVLKEMRTLGMTTLKATPPTSKYLELEAMYLAHLKKMGVQDFAEHDLATWKKYALSRDRILMR